MKSNNMNRYKAVLLDLDDTLIDFKRSEAISLRKCYARYFHHLAAWEAFYDNYTAINRALWKQAEEGKIGTSTIGALRFQQLSELYRVPFLPKIVRFFEEQLIQNCDWIDGAEELLETIKKRSLPIAFITNGFTHLQRDKQKKLRLSRFSDIMVVSEECGVAKPHPKIFQTALDQLQAEAPKTLMIGDSLSSDGQGAKNLQMPFCWYNPHRLPNPPDFEPDVIIHSLRDGLTIF